MSTKKKALILYGGWEGHQPEQLADFYSRSLTGRGFEVTSVNDLGFLDQEGILQNYDILLPFWTMGDLAEDREDGLVAAISGGMGVLGIHCSADAFRSATDYQLALGGQFVWHPEEDVTYEVRFRSGTSPLVDGLDRFSVTGEQYHVHVDPTVTVLATHVMALGPASGEEMPTAWIKQFGLGRVFYLSVGHHLAEHRIPEVEELVGRAVEWVTRSEPSSA
jgi:type 1 glutamine amidotransferase